MSAQVSQTPDAARAEAARKLAERDNGIRAAAIKEGRRLERIDADAQTKLIRAEHAGAMAAQLAGFEREEAKAVNAAYHRGALHWSPISMIVGAALACAAVFTMQGVIWDTATQAFREQAMTGAILSAGERSLPDRN